MKHTTRTIPRTLIGGVILIALMFTACTSEPAVGPSPSSSAAAAATTDPTAAPPPLPLDAYMNSLTGLSGSYAHIQEQNYQLDVKREKLIAACMKNQGFNYTSEAVKNTAASGQVGPSDADLDNVAWVSKYGYGQVYTPEGTAGEIQRTQNAAGNAKKQSSGATATVNGRYKASLSSDEQEAYDKALYGEDGSDSTLTIAKDWKRLGCDGAALHSVKNESVIMNSSEGQAVEQAIERFDTGYSTWPGISAAEKAWSTCMSKAGYTGYQKQNEPGAQIAGENTALWNGLAPGEQPAATALNALAAKERTVALADLSCRTSTKYTSTIRAITVKQQNQFLADNKVALAALKATTRPAGK